MRFRHPGAALLAVAALMLCGLPAHADNYVIRDGTGAQQTFCSKVYSDVQIPCHLLYGLFGGAPVPVAVDGSGNLGVNVEASVSLVGADGTTPSTLTNSAPVQDTNSAAFLGEVTLVVGTEDIAPRRSLKAVCTSPGNVSVTYADASIGVWPVVVGVQTLPVSITTVNSSGTTASCTYANLK
jgi:hypothetical protein